MLTTVLFQPDYGTMATYFGQGASYDSLQNQFRKYRRMADTMKGSTEQAAPFTPNRRRNGGVPTTPRSGRVTKSTSAKKSTNFMKASLETPTKAGIVTKKNNIDDPIILDDDEDEDIPTIKHENSNMTTAVKEEIKPESVVHMADMFSALAHHGVETPKREPTAHTEDSETQYAQPQLLPNSTLGHFAMPQPNHLPSYNNDSDDDIIV